MPISKLQWWKSIAKQTILIRLRTRYSFACYERLLKVEHVGSGAYPDGLSYVFVTTYVSVK